MRSEAVGAGAAPALPWCLFARWETESQRGEAEPGTKRGTGPGQSWLEMSQGGHWPSAASRGRRGWGWLPVRSKPVCSPQDNCSPVWKTSSYSSQDKNRQNPPVLHTQPWRCLLG